MALTVSELFEGSRTSAGDVRYNTGQRRFLVTATANEIPRHNAALANGLPKLGDPFFFNERKLTCVAYRVLDTVSPYANVVEFDYDDIELEVVESTSIEPKEEKYPFYLPEKYLGDFTGTPTVAAFKNKWVLREMAFENYYVQHSVTLFLRMWTSVERAAIVKQAGSIHKFDNMLWQFKGCNADREGTERFRITYRWIGDPGFNPAGLLEWSNTPYIIPRHLGTDGFSNIVRGPFETYIAAPAKGAANGYEDNPNTPEDERIPHMYIIQPKNVNEDGYRELPGNPIR